MVSKITRAIAAIWYLCLLSGFSQVQAAEHLVTEVFPNIFVMAGGEGIGSNTTFITTPEGVIVIDTRRSPAAAEQVLAEIRKHSDLPVKFAINTSFRGDHVYGNQIFRKTGTIIAHKNVGKSLLGNGGRAQWEKYQAKAVLGLNEVEITFPNMVYEKKLALKIGGYYMELRHYGRGITSGDTVIYLPTFRALIAGDVIVNREIPSMEYAFIEEWIQTIFSIESLNIEIIIPGHGGVTQKPVVILMRQYLMALKSQVQKQIDAGKTLKETQDAVRPFLQKKYSDWTRQDRIDGNIRRAYMEFSFKKPSGSSFDLKVH